VKKAGRLGSWETGKDRCWEAGKFGSKEAQL